MRSAIVTVFSTLIWTSATSAELPQGPQIFADTPARIDPARPLKIGGEFYPAESVRSREEGKCVVEMVVDKSGDIRDPKIITSSGFDRLDAACITALTSGHLLPAMKNGFPVESTATMPIIWSLPKATTLDECMAIPASVTLASAQTGLGTKSKGPPKGVAARTVLRIFVSESGTIDGAIVDQSSGFARIDEASLKSVSGQTMTPAKVGNQPVASCVTLPIVWKLN